MIGIYKFTNKITGESYIGQSVNIQVRYNQHKNRYDKFSKEVSKENTYFHSMLRHYGFHNFDFEVLEECSSDELNQKEQYYIEKFNTLYPNGYNKTIGGQSVASKKITPEILESIIKDLKFSDLSEIEIANKYGVILNTISMINLGKSWFNSKNSYPIRSRTITKHYCKVCGKEIGITKNGLCRDCFDEYRTSKIPTKDCLYNLLLSNSFLGVGKIFGVSDNAVRKWCDFYNIPRHSKYYRSAAS